MNYLLEFIIGMLATVGFSYAFNVPKRIISYNGLSGALGRVIYLLIYHSSGNMYRATLVSAFAVTFLGEAYARTFKMPALCFTIPSILCLCPGSGIYYTMSYFVENKNDLAVSKLLETLVISGAIAFGIMLASAVFKAMNRIKAKMPLIEKRQGRLRK